MGVCMWDMGVYGLWGCITLGLLWEFFWVGLYWPYIYTYGNVYVIGIVIEYKPFFSLTFSLLLTFSCSPSLSYALGSLGFDRSTAKNDFFGPLSLVLRSRLDKGDSSTIGIRALVLDLMEERLKLHLDCGNVLNRFSWNTILCFLVFVLWRSGWDGIEYP